MKTSEATPLQIDYLVAKCKGGWILSMDSFIPHHSLGRMNYSTDWALAGPIIERECIAMWPDEEGGFLASANEGAGRDFHGETYLIAAMRCYVASKLGDEVDVPNELI